MLQCLTLFRLEEEYVNMQEYVNHKSYDNFNGSFSHSFQRLIFSEENLLFMLADTLKA